MMIWSRKYLTDAELEGYKAHLSYSADDLGKTHAKINEEEIPEDETLQEFKIQQVSNEFDN